MSAKELTSVRILLFIARILAPSEWTKEIESLSTHITVNLKEGR